MSLLIFNFYHRQKKLLVFFGIQPLLWKSVNPFLRLKILSPGPNPHPQKQLRRVFPSAATLSWPPNSPSSRSWNWDPVNSTFPPEWAPNERMAHINSRIFGEFNSSHLFHRESLLMGFLNPYYWVMTIPYYIGKEWEFRPQQKLQHEQRSKRLADILLY